MKHSARNAEPTNMISGFSGGYHEYFGSNVDQEGLIYLMLVSIRLSG